MGWLALIAFSLYIIGGEAGKYDISVRPLIVFTLVMSFGSLPYSSTNVRSIQTNAYDIEPTIVVGAEGEEFGDITIVDSRKEEAALLFAASKGLFPELKRALNRGAAINSVDEKFGNTALMWAAANGKLEIVLYLLRKGADTHVISHKGDKTALLWAIHHGYTSIVSALLDHGTSVNHHNVRGDSPLIVAAYTGNLGLIHLLYDRGASIHHTTITHGYQAIHLAAFKGHREVVSFLIDKGANVHAVDVSGNTALMLAAMEGQDSIVSDFLKTTVNINAQDIHGNTALMLAVLRGHSGTARILMERLDCEIHLFNKQNDHVLFMAVQTNQSNIVEDIILFGLEQIANSSVLGSAIAQATTSGQLEIASFLKQFKSSAF